MEKNISVLMSVYKNDKAENVKIAIESIVNQTLKAKQIVIMVDGPVGEDIINVLNEAGKNYKEIEIYFLEENVGLGKVLNMGTDYCKYEYIARMDSDDIASLDRFEKQMKCFEQDPELSVVGTNGQEFFNTKDNLAGVKVVPEKHDEIVKFMKSRCPFCHMTVMMKKEMLIKAGGYQHFYHTEDYYLWLRMYLAGAKFYNIQEVLMYIRIDYDTFARRGGLKYFKSIKNIFKFMKQNKIIGFFKYHLELTKRFIGHVLVPKKLKRQLYMKVLRKKS